jgi:hypothetical protein
MSICLITDDADLDQLVKTVSAMFLPLKLPPFHRQSINIFEMGLPLILASIHW